MTEMAKKTWKTKSETHPAGQGEIWQKMARRSIFEGVLYFLHFQAISWPARQAGGCFQVGFPVSFPHFRL